MRRAGNELLRQSRPYVLLSRPSTVRHLSNWKGHGTDLLSDSLADSSGGQPVPKIVLTAHGATGYDVLNLVKNMDPTDDSMNETGGVVHMTGSVLAFPSACFLWNVRKPSDLTIESLMPIILHRPALEYLFIGSKHPVPPQTIIQIKQAFVKMGADRIVVEQMDVVSNEYCRLHDCTEQWSGVVSNVSSNN
jgi:uncharacterized protein